MGVGSGARDWLALLCAGLERLGVGVLAARSVAGEMLLELSDGGGGRLVVTASREDRASYYAEADGLFLRYEGAGALADPSRRVLEILLRLLGGMASRIPEDLDAATARPPAGAEPQERLAFAFPFCTVEREASRDGSPRIAEVLVRVTGRCNQACPFCSAPIPRPDPSASSLARLFASVAAEAPDATITLTGGEPTLRPDLPRLVRDALSAVPRGSVEVQSNAVRLADRGRAEELPAPSPRLRFFVSLHGTDEKTYDASTGTVGMLDRALAGIGNLLDLGHEVVLSCVVSSLNVATITSWVDEVASRFPRPNRPRLHFSITLCPEHRAEAADYLVRYRELGRALAGAQRRAEELGLAVEPLLSSTHAAIPACMVDRALQRRQGPPPIIEPHETGLEGEGRPWVKAARCRSCAATASCLGVPAAYAARFGLEDLDPTLVGDD